MEFEIKKLPEISEVVSCHFSMNSWEPVYIEYGPGKIFLVNHSISQGTNYLCPISKYNIYEFENLFRFGNLCQGFKQDKIIRVLKW